jgi:hypothetical protein
MVRVGVEHSSPKALGEAGFVGSTVEERETSRFLGELAPDPKPVEVPIPEGFDVIEQHDR